MKIGLFGGHIFTWNLRLASKKNPQHQELIKPLSAFTPKSTLDAVKLVVYIGYVVISMYSSAAMRSDSR